MSRAAALLTAALGVLAGCSLPLDSAGGYATVNTCSTGSDCADGAACQQGKCVATRYDLEHLLLTVRPHSDSTFGGGAVYVLDPGAEGVPLVGRAGSTPFLTRFDKTLSPPKSIRGAKVLLDPTTQGKGCNYPDGSVPAQLTFYRQPRLAGLPADPIQVTTTAVDGGYAFDLDLVSDKDDRYDVYIEPATATGCTIPPYYLPDQSIDETRKVWQLPPTGTLNGTIFGLTDTSGWQVDLLERTRGLVISAGSHLQFSIGSMGASLGAQIPPIEIDPSIHAPILRLTPVDGTKPDPKPVDPTRPTVYWVLQGVVGGTDSNPTVEFTVQDLAIVPVDVQGHVLGTDGITGVASRLTIQSQLLKGMNAGNAAFSTTTAQTLPGDPSAAFDVSLPPGDYSVRIFPVDDRGLSITDRQINWPANLTTPNCVCGVTFELLAKASLAGTLWAPGGQAVANTTVGITPTVTLPRSYLADTHKLPPLPVRVETTTTDGGGSFSLLADLGITDLTVQTDPATNFPWLVIPQLSPGSAAPLHLVLTNPAFLTGVIRDPAENPVSNAQIDAWYPVRDPSNPAVLTGTVVKIATTSTDASGNYTLVLPSSI